jgi:3-oxoacyl-(acyl-carrier-protein) synthase
VNEIVVSGLGALGSFGCGADRLAVALRDSTPRLSEVQRSVSPHRDGGARLAALVGMVDLSPWLNPTAARRMSGPSKLAVAAAMMALRDAGLEEVDAQADGTGVVMSTAFGPADFSERLFTAINREGPESASPFLFTESVANAPAAQVAIRCHARGPNLTVTQREAGPLIALLQAAQDVREGRMSRALVGSVDEITPLIHGLLDRFGALARSSDGSVETARPFDRARNGLVAGEGATVLVVERDSDVRARGGHVLARIRGGGRAFDPTASRVGWGDGVARLATGLGRALSSASLHPDSVDLVVSGASGSWRGDRLEALVLRNAWDGTPLPPIVAPKAITGEYGGGLLAAAVLAVARAEFGPTPGFAVPDPELGVIPHDGGPLSNGRVLVSSLAAGGAAAWLVLERP